MVISAERWVIVLAVLAVAALMWLGILSVTRATRLNRLHVRVDLARTSLIAALDRRAVVARAIAVPCTDRALGTALTRAADTAEGSAFTGREDAENRLAAVLAQVDPAEQPTALIAELADAQARVSIGRRFYNDSVRDARTLGGRRMVRLLRLGGHACVPDYFEISERVRSA